MLVSSCEFGDASVTKEFTNAYTRLTTAHSVLSMYSWMSFDSNKAFAYLS